MRKNQKGFTILEALLVVITVGAVAVVSWHFLHARGNSTTSSVTTSSHQGISESTAGNINVTYADKGKIIFLTRSQTLTVSLPSTYWTIHSASNDEVIKMTGSQTTTESQPCAAGEGCGTAAAHFMTVAPGTAIISASRNACGEALMCTGGKGQFDVTVTVE